MTEVSVETCFVNLRVLSFSLKLIIWFRPTNFATGPTPAASTHLLHPSLLGEGYFEMAIRSHQWPPRSRCNLGKVQALLPQRM